MSNDGWRAGGRGVAAGLVGTAVMTTTYLLEHRLRRAVTGPLDYDDSTAPGRAAATVLRLRDPSDRTVHRLGLLVHWGYGSAVGLGAVPLVRRLDPPAATAVYWAGMTVMAATLFPTLARTPPPWRWPADVLATSAVQHAIYASTVVAVVRRGGRHGRVRQGA